MFHATVVYTQRGHTKTVCRYKESTCHLCQKKGHLKKVCRNKEEREDPKKKQQRGQHLQGPTEDDDRTSVSSNDQDSFYCLQSELNSDMFYKAEQKCNSDCEGEPMYEIIIVNGMKIRMEIDTGTYVTVISEKLYESYFKNCKIEETGRKLKTCDEKTLTFLGKLTNLTVKFRNNIYKLECFVLPGTDPALIGRQWLAAFKL